MIPLTLSPVGPEAGESRSEWPRLRDSIPIVEARRRAHYFLRKVDSIGAKSARNTAALPAEVTPGVVALPAAAVAITGPYGDAGRALNLPARGGRDRRRPGSGRFAMQVRAGEKPGVAGERHHAADMGSRPQHEAALMRRQGGQRGREGFRVAGPLPKLHAAWTSHLVAEISNLCYIFSVTGMGRRSAYPLVSGESLSAEAVWVFPKAQRFFYLDSS